MNARSRTISMLAKLVVVTLAALSIGYVAAPTPAMAANRATFCFAAGAVPIANHPVHLMQYNFSTQRWDWSRNGRTQANGCATFYNTPTDKYIAVMTHLKWGGHLYQGWTRHASPGKYRANLGHGRWHYICSQCSAD